MSQTFEKPTSIETMTPKARALLKGLADEFYSGDMDKAFVDLLNDEEVWKDLADSTSDEANKPVVNLPYGRGGDSESHESEKP